MQNRRGIFPSNWTIGVAHSRYKNRAMILLVIFKCFFRDDKWIIGLLWSLMEVRSTIQLFLLLRDIERAIAIARSVQLYIMMNDFVETWTVFQ